MRTRTFLLTGLLVAFLVAGVASYYASTHPDGLQYVAEKAGFADRADHSGPDSPLAGYHAKGVDQPRLSRGVSGVLGALTVLAVGGGLFWLLRRRTPGSSGEADHDRVAP